MVAVATQHTRGPWHAHNIEDRWDGNITAVVSTGPNTGKLVTIARHVSADNGRLIAAAPALYEMLKELLADCDDVDDGKLPAVSAATIVRARTALARATGAA